VIDFARAFNSYVVIANASREGARYASHFPHLGDDIRAAAKQEAEGSSVTLEDEDIEVTPEPVQGDDDDDPANAQPGDPITVTVSYDFPTILGDLVGASSLTLRARTVMVVFGQD
jgi:hypothetical protein